MRHLSIDIETYSSVDLKSCGLYRYVQSQDFEVLLFAYAWDWGEVKVVDLTQGEQLPDDIVSALDDPDVVKHAFNAQFEWCCLNKFWKSPIEQWYCTMINAMYRGYSGGLGVVAKELGLSDDKQKSSSGSALIRIFSLPNKPTKTNNGRTRTLPHHEPEKWILFKEYCRQDVVTEMAVAQKLINYPLPEYELALWHLDILINSRGVKVDKDLIRGALYCSDIVSAELTREAIELTGLSNPGSVQQLKKWLEDELDEELDGEIPDLSKETVSNLINDISSEKAQRVLEIRQELSKTSVKKFTAMNNTVCQDGRVRGMLQFYGANRTGRWAGRQIQLHNLPQNHLVGLTAARDIVKNQNINALKILYGNVPNTLSQLIRTAFIPKEGRAFVVADFSAIEARVIAWLAGESWRQEVFATHGKIYEASASNMFGIPIELIRKGNPEYALRQKGKIAELALGYGGSNGALTAMGALKMGLTEEELPDIVRRWRQSNLMIVQLWSEFQEAAFAAYQGNVSTVKGITFAREVDFSNGLDALTIKLPSGRKLYYVKPFIGLNKFDRKALHYYGAGKSGKLIVQNTFGGKLAENIVQAISRDCLAENMMRLAKLGHRIVMHVHDEVVIEGSDADIQSVCDVMGQPLEWAPGLLLKAEGFSCNYYRKE